MNRWKIKVDGEETWCILDKRPSVNIEEILQPDGSFLPGKVVWEELKVNPCNAWDGEKDVEIIMYDDYGEPLEVWTFLSAKSNGHGITFSGVQYKLCGHEITSD